MTAPHTQCQPATTEPYQHVCPDGYCIYRGKPSSRNCVCHRTREQMMSARIEELTKALAAERERCALIAVSFGDFPGRSLIKDMRAMCGNAIADKIRETPVVPLEGRGGAT